MSGLFPFFLFLTKCNMHRFSEKETIHHKSFRILYMYIDFCLFVRKFDKIKQNKQKMCNRSMNENDSKDSSIYARLKSLQREVRPSSVENLFGAYCCFTPTTTTRCSQQPFTVLFARLMCFLYCKVVKSIQNQCNTTKPYKAPQKLMVVAYNQKAPL